MPKSGWLTPDPPGVGFICRRLLIPNSMEFEALVHGALLSLIEQYNWTQFGSMTPEEVSDMFRVMVDDFAFPVERSCRMIGEIVLFAGPDSPNADWLRCDGASLARADYADLFAVIGTAYGSLDGSHFNLPDLRGRTPIMAGAGDGLTSRTIGETGGEETHVLTSGELANHTHSDAGHTHGESTAIASVINGGLEAPAAAATPGVGNTGVGFSDLSSAGDDDPHNNMPPFAVIDFWIVAK